MERLAKIRARALSNLENMKVAISSADFREMSDEDFIYSLRDLHDMAERNYKIIEQIDAEVNYLVEWCEENG